MSWGHVLIMSHTVFCVRPLGMFDCVGILLLNKLMIAELELLVLSH